MGSGTTLVEAKLLERNAIGVDINLDAVMVARDRLHFSYNQLFPEYKEPLVKTYWGDARNLCTGTGFCNIVSCDNLTCQAAFCNSLHSRFVSSGLAYPNALCGYSPL